jgi:hypothetical protein
MLWARHDFTNGHTRLTAQAEAKEQMPIRPYWLGRLPEIIAGVFSLSTPALGRRLFERIFRLRRRRAIELNASTG